MPSINLNTGSIVITGFNPNAIVSKRLVSAQMWNTVKKTFRQFHDDVEKQPVTWYRSSGGLDIHYSDKNTETYKEIHLEGLIEYNFRRSWPIDSVTPVGTIDGEHCRLILNKTYLEELGYINADGYFAFDPGADKFKISGKMYKALGNSDVSQNSTSTLFATIILKREEQTSPINL